MSDCKRRKPNWTKDECLLLTQLVEDKKKFLTGQFTPEVTYSKRQEAWQNITQTLNATSTYQRTKEEVEKKWKNLKSMCKKNYSLYNSQSIATGGGSPPVPLSPLSDAVLNTIGKDNVTVTGIENGLDSCMMQVLDIETHKNQFVVMAQIHQEPSSPLITSSPKQPVFHPVSFVQDSPTSPTNNFLIKEKLKLEIECLKLKKKYLQMKIEKLEN